MTENNIKNQLCKKIKNDITNLTQNELEEIFKIIFKNNNNYSKNNNGICINISTIDDNILNVINNYIDFCIKSHNEINKYEIICNNFSDALNLINKEKDKNDEIINLNNTIDINNKNKQKISSYMKFYLLKKKFAKQSLINNNKHEKHLTHEEYLL
jgi:hypothetical protein